MIAMQGELAAVHQHVHKLMFVWKIVACVWSPLSAEYESIGYGFQYYCSWSAEHEKQFVPCPRLRLRIWSHEIGSAFPSPASPLILHTRAESVGCSNWTVSECKKSFQLGAEKMDLIGEIYGRRGSAGLEDECSGSRSLDRGVWTLRTR